MKTKIWLVRHTETVGNVEHRLTGRKDYEITNTGWRYVEELTNHLKDIKFDVAYCSTSERTKKTIEKLAKINNLNIIKKEELCEMYFGIYDGMEWAYVDKIAPNIREKKNEINQISGIPEQETTQEVAIRMYNSILNIARENIGKNILICSHGVAIEAFLRKITGVPFSEQREKYSQRNTSINTLEIDDKTNKFNILFLNDISHIK